MTILYNCRHSGDQYRITKFDSEMNVESSYLCTLSECDCPRGPHPTCRHRQMLPKFISRQHVGDEWFLDFDRGGWVQMGPEYIHTLLPEGAEIHPNEHVVGPGNTEEPTTYVREPRQLTGLPEGVTMIVMDHPDRVVDVHNAIADAVGEPITTEQLDTAQFGKVLHERPTSPSHIKRRL